MESFKRAVGPQYAQPISRMEKDAFPLILILMRLRNSIEIASIIEGKSTTPEVLESLMKSHDTFTEQRERDMEEETERKKRENLKKQQEDEYNQSLKADLAKEQARLADERKQEAEKLASEQLEKKRVVNYSIQKFSKKSNHSFVSREKNESLVLVYNQSQVKRKKI